MSQHIFSLSVAFLQKNFIVVLMVGTALFAIFIWRVSSWKTAVDMDRKTFNDFIKEIRSKIDEILLRLPLPATIQSKSPITLTELGEKVANEIKVDEWIDAYVDKLQEHIEDKTNPYEIQSRCFRYAKKN